VSIGNYFVLIWSLLIFACAIFCVNCLFQGLNMKTIKTLVAAAFLTTSLAAISQAPAGGAPAAGGASSAGGAPKAGGSTGGAPAAGGAPKAGGSTGGAPAAGSTGGGAPKAGGTPK
jgi:hypothetical protein